MRKAICFLLLLTMVVFSGAITSLLVLRGTVSSKIASVDQEKGHLLYLRPTFFAHNSRSTYTLTYEDINELKGRIPEIMNISLWTIDNIMHISFRDIIYPDPHATFIAIPLLCAVMPELADVMGLELREGRFITQDDVKGSRRVGVIGSELHKRLGGGNIIGESISLEMFDVDGQKTQEEFVVVGVLERKLPLLESVWLKYQRMQDLEVMGKRLPFLTSLSQRVFLRIAHVFFAVPRENASSLQQAQLVQREQFAFANFAINSSVFVPWFPEFPSEPLPTGALVYMRVDVPEDRRGEIVLTQITTCRRAEPCGHGQGSDLHYWPQGVAEIGEKIRDVLRERRGDDKVFQFLYQGSFGDNIREQARPLATLLNLATAGSLLATLLVVAMLLIFDRRGARELLVGVYGLRGMIAGYAGALAGVALSHFVVTGLLGWSYPQLTYATALAAVAVPAVYLCGLCALRVAKRKISL